MSTFNPAAVTLDLGGLSGFTPHVGFGSGDLLTHDGIFAYTVEAMRGSETSTKPAKPYILTGLSVLASEDPENGGRRVNQNVFVGGTDKNGAPMIRQLGEFLHSAGFTVEQVREFAGKSGVTMQAMIAYIEQNVKVVYGRTVSETLDDGRQQSAITGFVSKEEYENAKKTGAHRKPLALRKASGAGTGGLILAGGLGGGIGGAPAAGLGGGIPSIGGGAPALGAAPALGGAPAAAAPNNLLAGL